MRPWKLSVPAMSSLSFVPKSMELIVSKFSMLEDPG
jgi:hypothetical protein